MLEHEKWVPQELRGKNYTFPSKAFREQLTIPRQEASCGQQHSGLLTWIRVQGTRDQRMGERLTWELILSIKLIWQQNISKDNAVKE